jgi:hypothetical protein
LICINASFWDAIYWDVCQLLGAPEMAGVVGAPKLLELYGDLEKVNHSCSQQRTTATSMPVTGMPDAKTFVS